ncbi:MAG: hypothetical protein ACXVGB_00300 [Mycobacteriaceae bacterium]
MPEDPTSAADLAAEVERSRVAREQAVEQLRQERAAGVEDKLFITLRDVYDLVKKVGDDTLDWQERHAAADAKSFQALNIKFYGILAGIISVLAVVGSLVHV